MKAFYLVAAFCLFSCAKPRPPMVEPEAMPAPMVLDTAEILVEFDPEDSLAPRPVYFDLNSAEVLETAQIDRAANLLAAGGRLRVVGHACPLGEFEYNHNLAERRAVNVKQYLIARWDVDPKSVLIESRGEFEPITRNPVLYQLNRRVEITHIKDGTP